MLNRQEISDAVLDSLKHELTKLEEQFPDLVTLDSPTQRVAGKPLSGFKKIKHSLPMLSLNDAFSEKELKEWEERIAARPLQLFVIFRRFVKGQIDRDRFLVDYRAQIISD